MINNPLPIWSFSRKMKEIISIEQDKCTEQMILNMVVQ